MKKNTIEFIEGDKWCRWNGLLMDKITCERLFGTDNEIDKIKNSYYLYQDNMLFLHPKDKLLVIISDIFLSLEDKPNITLRYGMYNDTPTEQQHIMSIDTMKRFKKLEIYPIDLFSSKVHNYKLYKQFYKDLDNYYNNLRNNKICVE